MSDTQTTIEQDPFLIRREHAAEIFIIRHGDAIPGEEEIIPSGIYDDLPLSRLGRAQALALAERLGSVHFDALYTSPLRRCQETAAPLAERIGLTPIIVPGLKEIHLGEIRSMPEDIENLAALTQALKERQNDIVRLAGATGNWNAIHGSESSKAFRGRVVEALDAIAGKHIGQRVAAFAHGGVVNAYVAEVLGLDKEFFYPAANTSITVVRVAGKHRVLYVLNDLSHVTPHG
jgi:probable phosphoglycerate mutase